MWEREVSKTGEDSSPPIRPVSSGFPKWTQRSESKNSDRPPRQEIVCHQCKRPGHVKSTCRALKRKEDNRCVDFVSVQKKEQEQADVLELSVAVALSGYECFVSRGVVLWPKWRGSPSDHS